MKDSNISEMDKKINGDAKPFTRILNILALVVDRGRLSMWLLIVSTTFLCFSNKIEGEDCRVLFTLYVCLSIGGEAIISEVIHKYIRIPKRDLDKN